MDKKVDLSFLASKWKSPIVARTHVSEFSGGILKPGTLANEDSAGTGPKVRIKIGKLTAYPVEVLIAWMEGRAEIVDREDAR